MRQANFIEDPAKRTLHDLPVGANVPGVRIDNVFIEVSVQTYITSKFQAWLMESVFTRISPECVVRIAVVSHG